MKKLLLLMALLMSLGLYACGKSSSSSDDEDIDCMEHPDLCEDNNKEPAPQPPAPEEEDDVPEELPEEE